MRQRIRRVVLGERRLHIESLEPRLALSVTILNETFDDDPVNAQPNTADVVVNGNGPQGFIQVAGPGGVYGTPIGPAGNKSLVIDNPGQAQPAIAWTTEFSNDPTAFQSGTISFDLLMPEPSGGDFWTYIDIRLGYGAAGRGVPTTINDTTIWNSFRVDNDQPDVVTDNGNGGGSSPIASFTLLHVVYNIDGVTRTYTLSINGSTINFGGSASRPWRAGAPGINTLAFVGGFPQSSSPLVIDNLVVIRDDVEPWTPPANEPTDRLEWHQHRGNKRLTGEANVSDDILTGAGVLWSQYVGSRESWVAASPGAGGGAVVLPDGNIAMSGAEQISWGVGGPYFDLAGTGALTAESTSSLRRIGDFIPGNGVLEKLEGEVFDTTFGQGVVRLSIYQNGNWVQQWQSPQIPTMHGTANLITGDFDNDGQLEVALTPWTTLYTLSMATGQIEKTATFKPSANESGRPYGWFGAYDLTGDGREEFILMGDFQDFIAVMGWDANGNIVKLWEHVFDPRLTNKRTTHRPGAFPVRDVTGDGQLDIATSVFNEIGDNRWHVKVFNALTGGLIHDLVDHVIDSARDVNGDGDYELFARQTVGPLLPVTSTVEILNWNGAGFNTLWSQTNAGFVSQPFADFPANVNSVASTGKLDLLSGPLTPGGPTVFFTQSVIDNATRLVELNAWQLDGVGGVTNLGSARGINLDVRAIRAAPAGAPSVLFSSEFVGANPSLSGDYDDDADVDGADFLAWQQSLGQSGANLPADGDGDGVIEADDLALWRGGFGAANANALQLNGFVGATPRFSQAGSPPRSSVTVGRLEGPASEPSVVLQGGSETIVALKPQVNGQVDIEWVRSGLGGFQGATQFQGQHENSGVALGDINGDGDLETLYAAQGESGQARLVAASPSGDELWHADFDVTGGKRIFNEPGLVLWRTGHFMSAEHEDVLVQIMRGIGGTGEFYMLSGLTGETLWTRDYGNNPGTFGSQRGAGEAHMPVYDWDGDGLDEFVNFNPDMFYVVDGDGGPNLVQKSVSGMFAGGQNPLYAQPIVADFRNNGTDSILFAGSYAQLGLTDRNGVQIWSTPFTFDNTPGFIQGVGDVDGDGDLDLLSPGHPIAPATYTASRFHAYNAATGALLWSVALPGRPFAPVGGAFHDTPTLSVSGDIDGDGRVESLFAIGDTLYSVGADPGGTSGRIEWSYRPDGGLLGSPVIADANGDGRAEIIVVSTSGYVYGIGNQGMPLVAEGSLAAAASNGVAPSRSAIGLAYPSTWWIDSLGDDASSKSLDRPPVASETGFENIAVASRRTPALTDAVLEQAFASTRWERVESLETSGLIDVDAVWSTDNWANALDSEHESFSML